MAVLDGGGTERRYSYNSVRRLLGTTGAHRSRRRSGGPPRRPESSSSLDEGVAHVACPDSSVPDTLTRSLPHLPGLLLRVEFAADRVLSLLELLRALDGRLLLLLLALVGRGRLCALGLCLCGLVGCDVGLCRCEGGLGGGGGGGRELDVGEGLFAAELACGGSMGSASMRGVRRGSHARSDLSAGAMARGEGETARERLPRAHQPTSTHLSTLARCAAC